jgi:isoquinoline 1-oxidoreductase subunit beta
MINGPKISRRSFIVVSAAIGGGLAIGINPFSSVAAVRAADESPEITAWVVIRPDDTIVVRIARSEMGQGSLTGLAQLVAEELECDWNKVTWEYPTPGTSLARKKPWGPFGTGGSDSIRGSQEYLRKGGAAARMMLVRAAANGWNVPAAECTVDKGVISHKATGRRTTYGKVAEDAAKLEVPKEVPLKDPNDWKIIGKPVKRLDTVDKLTGKQIYGADIKLPGMLNASIKASPVFGGKVKSIDARKAEAMPGVKKIVRVGDSALAVIADTWWHANTALDALRIEWDAGENAAVSSASIDAMLNAGLGAEQAFVHENKSGDSKAAIAGAAKRIEAIYDYPFQNHACMEPMNATALYTPERCEVWCPTQTGHEAIEAAAEAAGLPVGQCDVHKVHLGGGFGRRGFIDYVTQAVLIAKEVPGTPVKLLWSREEDMAQGRYHPVTKAKLTGGLDSHGNLTGLEMRISSPSILASVMPKELKDGKDEEVFEGLGPTGDESLSYSIANLTIDHAMRNTHVPPGFWRGVTVNHNAIFLECFVDELAHAAGQDALEFRRKLMVDHPKALALLDAVAKNGGWGEKTTGRYRGLAHFHTRGGYVAALAEISVGDGKRIKIHRIVLGIDPGYAVNPAQIERQIAGCVAFSLSALFYQECTVSNGCIMQENFDSYDSMRIAQMPKVEAIIMPSGGFWGGVGEPPVCVAPPAVLNAYFAATGKRVRSFPLKNHDIQLV